MAKVYFSDNGAVNYAYALMRDLLKSSPTLNDSAWTQTSRSLNEQNTLTERMISEGWNKFTNLDRLKNIFNTLWAYDCLSDEQCDHKIDWKDQIKQVAFDTLNPIGNISKPGTKYTGTVSYYQNSFIGKTTASGIIFDGKQSTIAVPPNSGIAIGTLVLLEYQNADGSKKSIQALVTDTMSPDVTDRIADLSPALYKNLTGDESGKAGLTNNVTLTILDPKKISGYANQNNQNGLAEAD